MPSALRPVNHGEDIPIPKPPTNVDGRYSDSSDENMDNYEDPDDPDPTHTQQHSHDPHLIEQNEQNDLVRDLRLSRAQAELLGSRLQEWNPLAKSRPIRVSVFINRNLTLSRFFEMQDGMCICSDISTVMAKLGIVHN